MVEIKETSRELSKLEQYLMTIAPNIESLHKVEDGTKIVVNGFLVFTDVKEDGEIAEILSIITPDKKVYSCQSKTFKQSFSDINMIMTADGENKPFTIIKISGKTKNGRDYINCVLDVENL